MTKKDAAGCARAPTSPGAQAHPAEVRNIEIPPNALTTCPDRRFALVVIAKRCIGCQYHQGFIDTQPGEADFNIKYRVACGVPQAREIFMADTGEDE